MTAASPGVIAHFLRNEYYPSRDAYLAHLTDIMKEEPTPSSGRFVLQLVADLGMGRHLAFPDLSTRDFVKIAGCVKPSITPADIP
jgi:5-methyltetrahydropteroyltriglutamate--homocysteine methyltransferase